MYSTVSHYRIPTPRPLTPLEIRALLHRHATCTPGKGHTPDNCSARTQLLQLNPERPNPPPSPATY
ncbi:hypothetical protein OHB26_07090 [Nocardia sp. NBC_01503]|uniref:hypothetical protein n=1 Tax=Nocardia sp. NBC_01503 TaxID=2975997 RepID=UPI002E7C37E9|nr:hypothetical protein [Nocardia sp. NBC_01503]WTL33974.1 hypothetical protein OHB26_07090 [Nocardia sp. NBC_01503]